MIEFFGDVIGRNYDVITFISKYFLRPRVAVFADIKIVTLFIKTILESKEVRRIRNYVLKGNQGVYFLKRLQVMYNSAKFHCRICVTDFREWPVLLDYFFRVIMILTSFTDSNYISWQKSFLLFQKLTEDFSVQPKLKTSMRNLDIISTLNEYFCEILNLL